MLSYRHSFHAGNFADVLKHGVLALLLDALRRKETPFCYIETHAGVGRYDLQGAAAQKTGEWRDGRLTLSHFDGSRPLLFEARIDQDGTLNITLDRKSLAALAKDHPEVLERLSKQLSR